MASNVFSKLFPDFIHLLSCVSIFRR